MSIRTFLSLDANIQSFLLRHFLVLEGTAMQVAAIQSSGGSEVLVQIHTNVADEFAYMNISIDRKLILV